MQLKDTLKQTRKSLCLLIAMNLRFIVEDGIIHCITSLVILMHYIVSNLNNQVDGKDLVTDIEEYSEENASSIFERDLKTIANKTGKKRILIIFDEIENLTFELSPSDHWAKDMDSIYFWQTIRSTFQKNEDLFSFLIAGVNPKIIETPTFTNYDNPLYRMMKPYYLELFNTENVREMVATIGNYMGFTFDDEIFTYLRDDFGGHPFIIRYVCSQISNLIPNRPAQVSKYFYQSKRKELNTFIQDYIELIISILNERYPVEYELLEYLAQDHIDTFMEYANTSSLLIEHLVGYGLINEDNGNYYFTIEAVREYISKKTKIKKLLHSAEEKWAAVSERRNKIEYQLRKITRQVLLTHYGKKYISKIIESIPRERREKLQNVSEDELLNNNLYFSDLMIIITYRWSEFSRIFGDDKSRFSSDMEIINNFRIDAHAKEISEENMERLQFALGKIEAYVEQYLGQN